MTDKDKYPVPDQDVKNEEGFSDEKTDMKIHRHISDQNDQITDQDIENVRTDIGVESTESLVQNDLKEEPVDEKNDAGDTGEEKDKAGEQDANPIITPWNILG
ncbi:MAG: hypothetical protein H7Z13_09530 [Ferruginibacter sp.]|nr:hypothetical protein [Ferruginibacter sp.]